MNYQNGFNINFKFEGRNLEIMPSTYSFSIVDSIYETFPMGEFIIKDNSGVLQEYLFTVEGAKYELSIGIEEENIICPFIVKNDELSENLTSGLVNGNVKVNLIHEFKNDQDIKSAHYKDKISNIVRSLAGNFNFNKINVEETGNNYDWYRPLKNQVDFINENLLPFAFSNSANESPFYYFINSKNEYCFKSFYSMLKGQKPLKLTLTQGTAQGTTNKSILSIKRLRKGLDVTYNLRHRKIFSFSDNTGDLLESDDYIYEYPLNIKSIPIIGNKDFITGVFNIDSKSLNQEEKENIQGYINSSMKNSMTLDRFVVITPFNPAIVSGIPVELVIPTGEGTDVNDYNLSGFYLTEKVIHLWDGERASTYTILGRKDSFIPDSLYAMKEKLYNA